MVIDAALVRRLAVAAPTVVATVATVIAVPRGRLLDPHRLERLLPGAAQERRQDQQRGNGHGQHRDQDHPHPSEDRPED